VPFFFFGIFALLAMSGSKSSARSVAAPRGEPLRAPAAPQRTDAPPVLANGTLGHTGQPAGMFWGLPMNAIWQVDSAYAAGDPFLMLAAADRIAPAPGFAGLAGLIRLDAQARSKALLQERTGNV